MSASISNEEASAVQPHWLVRLIRWLLLHFSKKCQSPETPGQPPITAGWHGLLCLDNLPGISEGWVLHVFWASGKNPEGNDVFVSLRGLPRSGKSTVRAILMQRGGVKILPSQTSLPDSVAAAGGLGNVEFLSVCTKGRNLVFIETPTSADYDGEVMLSPNNKNQKPLPANFGFPSKPPQYVECFTRDLSLALCDVSLLVVNGIGDTPADRKQMDAMGYAMTMSQTPFSANKLLIIHNFKDVESEADFAEKFDRVCEAFPSCGVMSEHVDVDGLTKSVRFLNGYRCEQHPGAEFQQHFCIAKNDSPAGKLNPWVMTKILSIITSVPFYRRNLDLKQRLEGAINDVLPQYLDPTPSPVQIDFGNFPLMVRLSERNAMGFCLRSNTSPSKSTDKSGDAIPKVEEVDGFYVVTLPLPSTATYPNCTHQPNGTATTYSVCWTEGADMTHKTATFDLPNGQVDPVPAHETYENGTLQFRFKKARLISGRLAI